VKSGL